MMSVGDRRHTGIAARLARLFFALGRLCAGQLIPRQYEYYAAKIPALDVIEIELGKVLAGGVATPEGNRDALMRLATQLGRTRREGVILRLALHDAGILVLPPDELEKIKIAYRLEDKP